MLFSFRFALLLAYWVGLLFLLGVHPVSIRIGLALPSVQCPSKQSSPEASPSFFFFLSWAWGCGNSLSWWWSPPLFSLGYPTLSMSSPTLFSKTYQSFWDAANLIHFSTRAFSDLILGFPLGFDLTAVSLVRGGFAGSFREGISGLRPSVLMTVSWISYQTRSKSSEVTSGWNSFWVWVNTRQSPRRQSSGNSPS